MNKLTYITGTFLIQAEGAFLNGAGLDTGEDKNAVIPKTFSDGRNRVPYVSAQAWRRWLRSTFHDEYPDEPAAEIKVLQRNPKGNPSKIGTEMNPIVYAEDDIFGYMRAEQGQGRTKEADADDLGEDDEVAELETSTEPAPGKGKAKSKTEKTKAVMRPSPFSSSILKSLRVNGWQGDDEGFVHLKTGTPLPYKTRFYNIAEGSVDELRSQLLLSKALKYCASIDAVWEKLDHVAAMLHRLIEAGMARQRDPDRNFRPILELTPAGIAVMKSEQPPPAPLVDLLPRGSHQSVTRVARPTSMSQILTVQSSLPETSRLPSGLKATQPTKHRWPVSRWRTSAVSVSHSQIE